MVGTGEHLVGELLLLCGHREGVTRFSARRVCRRCGNNHKMSERRRRRSGCIRGLGIRNRDIGEGLSQRSKRPHITVCPGDVRTPSVVAAAGDLLVCRPSPPVLRPS